METNKIKFYLNIVLFLLSVLGRAASSSSMITFGFGEAKVGTVAKEMERLIHVTRHENRNITNEFCTKFISLCKLDLKLLLTSVIYSVKYKLYSLLKPEELSLISLKVRLNI